MRKWNTIGYYDGHQHAKNVIGFFSLVKILFNMKSTSSVNIRVYDEKRNV